MDSRFASSARSATDIDRRSCICNDQASTEVSAGRALFEGSTVLTVATPGTSVQSVFG